MVQKHVPDIAVFVDGLNDAERGQDNKPAFSDVFAQSFEKLQDVGRQSPARYSRWSSLVETAYKKTPVERAVNYLKWRLRPEDMPTQERDMSPENACDCYINNVALIQTSCRRFDVTPLFVWQPIPGYKYDMKYHLFAAPDQYEHHGRVYAEMATRLSQHDLGTCEKYFLWCADIQDGETECLYVDSHHYTA